LLVELLGLTPALEVVFAGAEHPLNLPPPVLVWLFAEELVSAEVFVEPVSFAEALTEPDEDALAD
jgi:hypothetical protein